MAARRLLIVMLILLGLSTLAAALIPPQALREGTTTDTTTTETETIPTDTVALGRELPNPIRITVGVKNTVPVVSCPPSLRRAERCKPIIAGDQLTVLVKSKRADQLEMPRFGLVDAVGPNEPARFEILVPAAGSYQIRFATTKRVAARIVVEKPGGAKKTDRRKPDGKTDGRKQPGAKKPARSPAPAEPDRS